MELVEILGLGFTGFLASFILTYVLSHFLIPILTHRKLTVEDFHKPGKPRIPRPGGPAIITAIAAVEIPTVEVHFSDINKREEFRQVSVISQVCIDQVFGLGKDSYLEALKLLIKFFD